MPDSSESVQRMPNARRYHKAIRQLQQRQAAFTWWVQHAQRHPLGLVPIATAARILGISRTRMHNYISEGKIKAIEGMPGAGRRDRFIPFEQLITAPIRANQGRPGVFGPAERRKFSTPEKSRESP